MNRIIHCLGPTGTYGHEVAKNIFPKIDEIIFHDSNSEILFSLEEEKSRDSSFGIVPIENSSAGFVTEVVKEFWLPNIDNTIDIEVVGEFGHFINHTLAKCGECSKIERIFSHPQALSQCSNSISQLETEFENKIELIPTSSTSGSISKMRTETDAVICSKFAAELSSLQIIKSVFNDNSDNQTLFHVLKKIENTSDIKTHTALLFTLKDRVHNLVNALMCISSFGANMHMIHSVSTGNLGEYAFYIEYDADSNSNKGQRILNALKNVVEGIIVLGSFSQIERKIEQ